VRFVILCTEAMYGGEVFIPKIPSTRIVDLARIIAPDAELEVIGIRPGEKLHEVLLHEEEARSSVELKDMFVVQPVAALWFGKEWEKEGSQLPEGFRYSSDKNPEWLSESQIREIVAPFEQIVG